MPYDLRYAVEYPLLHIILRRKYILRPAFRHGQSTFIYLLILRVGYLVYPHGNGRHHIRRFFGKDKVFQRVHIDLTVGNYISRKVFTSRIVVKCHDRSIFNTVKTAYYLLHLT